MKITVKDSICGHGKTFGMVKHTKNNRFSGERYLYITPYLEQCHTIAGTKPISKDDERPDYDKDGIKYNPSERNLGDLQFKHPDFRNSEGTKQESLKKLLDAGENIVSTHSLFLNMKLDTLSSAGNYTLVIDEALDIYDRCKLLTEKQAKKLLRLKILNLRDDGITLLFDREKFGDSFLLEDGEDAVEDTHYEELAVLCDNKQILLVNGCVLLWEFSAEILKKFKKVYILTYLFEGREMSVYLKKHGLEYEVIREGNGGKDVAPFVDILEDEKLNNIGDNYFALSISQTRVSKKSRKEPLRKNYDSVGKFEKAKKRYESYMSSVPDKSITAEKRNDELRRNIHTVFSSRWKAKADDRYFTCLSENADYIAGKNYKNNWLGYSTRATNLYNETHHVAFLMNLFMQPNIKEACDSTDYQVDEDLVALSHLIQFVFRSALRSGENIKLYIPSSRMRNLFKDYLKGEYD